MKIAVLTASDRCSSGETTDKSGPLICETMRPYGEVIDQRCVPDDMDAISSALTDMCDREKADLILTTGGTGFAPRDVTPEATEAVIEKKVPGIPEAIRAESLKITPRAMLSRATAGIRGGTLIINLPGSPKAVRESLAVILPALPHAMETLSGVTQSCGKE